MAKRVLPTYPVYVITKGRSRYGDALTARFLLADECPFRLVVEPEEEAAYRETFPNADILVTPENFSKLGLGSIPVRNFVWEHSISLGAERHWILDDNIRDIRRAYKGRRIPCDSGPALRVVEDFTDRYENVGIAGLNYQMFVIPGGRPFAKNVHVYSCLLIQNDLPYRWRGRYNEDTDLCLQVLSGGLCTLQVSVFMIDKMPTMTMAGGNTDELYADDGRLRMARSLERVWPYVVTVDRRFKRPQHKVRGEWRNFDTPLRLKPGVDLKALAAKPNEYGMDLVELRDVQSDHLRRAVLEPYRENTT